jgi:drug/metabolite transporter (DMT)-like permease
MEERLLSLQTLDSTIHSGTNLGRWSLGGFASVGGFGESQWLAIAWLGIVGGALTFLLWSFALSRTTPIRVAISVTVNPIVAGIVGRRCSMNH